ncbi:MAG: Uma2 family endonuclease [Peptococcaceae bacterium]|jgi:Uma2 family endonuclease|nr:Uma2 family endonuclease [Peptococcaceae bacterium]
MDELRETVLSYRKKATYEDYAKLPEGAPYQLIGGELVLSPAPETRHQRTKRKLVAKMSVYVEEHDLGEVFDAPTDVYFNDEETYQPDVLFIPWDRGEIVEKGMINGAPDLVVEVLSPSTAKDDLTTKFTTYERYGVKEYWVINPKDNSVKVYLRNEGRLALGQVVCGHGLIQSKVLSGFAVEAEYLFRRR